MTRDEAVAKANEIYELWRGRPAKPFEQVIDLLSALGVLTLDEPKTVEQEADELLTANFVHGQDALKLLRLNGFTIVRVLSSEGKT